jgi:hypothetical protein
MQLLGAGDVPVGRAQIRDRPNRIRANAKAAADAERRGFGLECPKVRF